MLHSLKWKTCIFLEEVFTCALHRLRFISEHHLKMGRKKTQP